MKAWRKDFTLLYRILFTCFLLGELVCCSEAQGIVFTLSFPPECPPIMLDICLASMSDQQTSQQTDGIIPGITY